MKNVHYWLAVFCAVVSTIHLSSDKELLAIYDALFMIANLLFAIYWKLEEE